MRTSPITRKRTASQPVVVGALSRIAAGLFGSGSPQSGLTEQSQIITGGFWHFHQGDLFLPGPASMVLDPSHETQIYTQWGHGWLNAVPNAFAPLSGGPPLFAHPANVLSGLGGPVSGQIVFQPLTPVE